MMKTAEKKFARVIVNISAEQLDRIFGALGFDRFGRTDLFRWNRAFVPGADCSYAAALAALSPFLNKFLKDDDVPDRDAVLVPSQTAGNAGARFAAFVQKLKAFFGAFAEILKNLVLFSGVSSIC